MSPHPLTSFEIQRYKKEPSLNGVYSRNILPERKDEAYIIHFNKNQ